MSGEQNNQQNPETNNSTNPDAKRTDGDGAGGSGGDQSGGNQGGGSQPETKSFTQAQLDSMFADRGRQAVSSLLKELGLESTDALKGIVTQAKDAQDAAKSDLEKAQSAAEKAQKERDEAKTAGEQAVARANERLMMAAVQLEAAKTEHGFKPEALGDVWVFIDRSALKVDEESGEVSGVAEAVKKVSKEKPYLLGASAGGPGTPPSRHSTRQPVTGKQPPDYSPVGTPGKRRPITRL